MTALSTMFATTPTTASDGISAGLLLLRVVCGLTLAAHGYNKFFGGGKIEGTARWFSSLGMRPNGKIHAYTAACTELGSGVLFAAGLLTPLAAAGMVGVMVVATWTHKDTFFVFKDGFEYNVVLAVVGISVAMISPGRFSLDNALDLSFAFKPGLDLALSAGLGIGASVLLLAVCWRPVPKTEDA